MGDLVDTAAGDGVATVLISNPPANALADPVLEALGEVLADLAEDPAVRAVVIGGAGERIFVAGADLRQFDAALADAATMEGHAALTRRVFAALDALPMPTIAAVGGHAAGGGLELALACDLIVADPRARLGLPEVTLGLIPGAGGSQRLPRRVGRSRATRMLLLGEMVDAATAHEVGLVDVVAEPGAATATAGDLARRLAALPGRAVAAAKAALRTAGRTNLDEGLERERELFLATAATADAREGVAAFLAKREPHYRHC
ncbi:MAG TPA: enoyl-CoA hydratase-related protein [Solirubrobacterales bacterium]|nr:enoyl-CoA hydratase-related protein [Solirubrobacterales bacterium]